MSQSFDESGKLLKTFSDKDPNKFQDKLFKALTDQNTKAVNVGKLPEKDTVLKIYGLLYKIVSVDALKGRFVAQLVKPEK